MILISVWPGTRYVHCGLIFFFFQAEDGIRDYKVTGVQTCALPISLLVPGGRFVAWLYAREGNGWVLALVDPARRLTSRLPLRLVSGLAGVVTVPLWIALRVLYAPARTRPRLARTLPYASYLTDLAPFPFREVHSIAFDHFLAPVAHYMARARVERCFAEGGLTLESLRWHHANSWAAGGPRPEAP